MDKDGRERSKGGSEILRHAVRDEAWQPPAAGVEGAHEAIEDHLRTHVGPVEMVYHELISDLVHLDVHWIAADDERPYHVLFTTGMGDLPMNVPDELEVERRAELLLALPPDWPMDTEAWHDERWYWPIRNLKQLARLPHEYDTWIGFGHTIPNGDPPQPYADDTNLCCALIAPPLLLEPEAHVVELPNGELLRLLAPIWLYRGEVDLKLARGADELFDRLDDIEASELVDLDRRDVSGRKKKLLGIF